MSMSQFLVRSLIGCRMCANLSAGSNWVAVCDIAATGSLVYSDSEKEITVIILSFWTETSGKQGRPRSDCSIYTVGISVCIFWTHYSMAKPPSSNFRVITVNFLAVRIFRIFKVPYLIRLMRKRDLSFVQSEIPQTRMCSHSIGWLLLCERTARALAILCRCTGLPELSLFAYVISILFSLAGSFIVIPALGALQFISPKNFMSKIYFYQKTCLKNLLKTLT